MVEQRQGTSGSGAGVTVIDAHTHVACPDRRRFPLRPSVGVGSEWYHGASVSGEDLVVEMDDAGVGRAVVVQGVGAYGHDCSCAASTVALHPDRFALVVSVDMDGVDPARDLVALVEALARGRSPRPVRRRAGRADPTRRGAAVRGGRGDDLLAGGRAGLRGVAHRGRARSQRGAVRVLCCARRRGGGGRVASRGARGRGPLRFPGHGRRRGLAGGAAAGGRRERGAQDLEPRAGGR